MKASEKIKYDLAVYFQKNNISNVEQGIQDLQNLLTPAILEANKLEDSPSGVIAWTAIQIKEGSPYRYYKSEKLGEFIYNVEMYTVVDNFLDGNHLHYNTSYNGEIELPEGCISTASMFKDCKLPEDFTLGDKFDTSKVTNMECMFRGCKLPEGFTLGDKFDTSNVTYMEYMFKRCELPEGFTLGDKFNTSNVTNMRSMFDDCTLPEGFTLGDKFDTSNVENMSGMFSCRTLPKGFTLGDKFDTSNVKDMLFMFNGCELPEGFTLGDKFDTSKVTNMYRMFAYCKLPEDFTLGDKFDTSKVIDMENMFYYCELPKGFTLGDKFNTLNVETMTDIFKECTFSEGFTLGDKFYPFNVSTEEFKLLANISGGKFDTSKICHKSKDLGDFIYNSEIFTIDVDTYDNIMYLHYNTSYSGEIELPKGCISTRRMFYCCELPEGFTLGNKFNTSNIVNMARMFHNCKFPDNFTLGDNFDTSNVKNMYGMFNNCKFPEGFTLGDKFDISNVTNMKYMFRGCTLPEGFTFGDKFDTSKVTEKSGMFKDCKLPDSMKFYTFPENYKNTTVQLPDSPYYLKFGSDFDSIYVYYKYDDEWPDYYETLKVLHSLCKTLFNLPNGGEEFVKYVEQQSHLSITFKARDKQLELDYYVIERNDDDDHYDENDVILNEAGLFSNNEYPKLDATWFNECFPEIFCDDDD